MMKKIVNGVEVECSPQEEAAFLAEWEANAAKAPPPKPITLQDVVSVLSAEQKAALGVSK